MENLVKDLVEFAKLNETNVEQAKQKKASIMTNMNSKRKEMYDDLMSESMKDIENHKKELLDQKAATETNLQNEFEQRLAHLDTLYTQNKDRWVQEIFERCIK